MKMSSSLTFEISLNNNLNLKKEGFPIWCARSSMRESAPAFAWIPQDSPSCYHSSMRNLAVLVIHLITVLARLLGPGGVRSVVPTKNSFSLTRLHLARCGNRLW